MPGEVVVVGLEKEGMGPASPSERGHCEVDSDTNKDTALVALMRLDARSMKRPSRAWREASCLLSQVAKLHMRTR